MSLLTYLAVASTGGTNYTSITAVNFTANTLNACLVGWVTSWKAVLSRPLEAGEQLYWEVATDSGGTEWGFWQRTTDLSIDYSDLTLGSNGAEGEATHYVKVRAYVIPTGGNPGSATSGPATSVQTSRTAQLCIE